jgi:hypothetical protein
MKQSSVGGQSIGHSVLRGCSHSVFAVVNKGRKEDPGKP